jgi:Acyl-CoA dehydrogenase, N-terminal domain
LRVESRGSGPLADAFFQKIMARGWTAVSGPKEYGGQGGSPMAQYIIEEEFQRVGFYRRCQVDGKRSVENLRPSTVSHSFRNSGDLAPNAERSRANGPVIIGSQVMAAKLEMVVDTAMGEKESLSMAG